MKRRKRNPSLKLVLSKATERMRIRIWRKKLNHNRTQVSDIIVLEAGQESCMLKRPLSLTGDLAKSNKILMLLK